MKTETIEIAKILRDLSINCRANGIDDATAKEYAAAIAIGAKLPPVVIFRDAEGTLRLADGFHRCRAHELADKSQIECELREGGARDALLHAIGCNAAHGLRRTNADKRRAVLALLADPEWSKRPHRELAKLAAVDQSTIGLVKRDLAASGETHQGATEPTAKPRASKAAKRTKRPKFSPARVAKQAPKVLDRLARGWPKTESLAPLVDSVKAWVESRVGAESAGA